MNYTNILYDKMKSAETLKEFIRYLFVGGSAFFIDIGVLFITKTFLFNNMGDFGILLATALGFIAGLFYNYCLSIFFVFQNAINKINGKHIKTFTVFAAIGIIGLGITECGMYFGITIFDSQYYLFVKVIVSIIVLFWNYLARKNLIFR